MTVTRSKNTRCPICRARHSRIAAVADDDDSAPKDGDVSMCFSCGAWLILDSYEPGGLRKPNAAERAELAQDSRLAELHAAWETHGQRGKNDTKGIQPAGEHDAKSNRKKG
jgi:hypothetical protein